MKAIILAGGLGTRLKPFTDIIPKPLLPVGEKSVLEIQLLRLKQYGFKTIFLATNYKSDYVKSFFGDGSRLGVKLTISKEEKPLGTCGPLSLIKDQLNEPFIVMNGDILTTIDFAKFYEFSLGADSDLVVATKEVIMPFAFGNIFSKGNYITGIEEKVDTKHEIIAGIYVMKPGIFRYIPDNQYFGMDTLIKQMLKDKLPVVRYLMREYWLDIGKIEDYSQAQNVYEEHFKDI